MRKIASGRARLAAAPVLLVLVVGALAACDAPPDTYVALGDSYTSGPLVLPQTGQPYGCLRSGKNYPALVAPQVSSQLSIFTDVSCSGATTDDMFAPQDVTPGPANPPQLDALSNRVGLVTIGIGGNDIGFSSIVQDCGVSLPTSSPCKDKYVHDGRDEISERIAADAPKVANTLVAIHQRAPRAKVLVVGYPTIIPETGNGCYPLVPVLPTDIAYLRLKVKELNNMLATQAAANGSTYVDTARSSIGHDFCASDKWVEGLIPTTDAAPVHPNAKGLANTAVDVGAAARSALGL